MREPTLIVVAGPAGAGKTTLGMQIAKVLHATFLDKDTISEAFTDYILGGNTRESELYRNEVCPLEYAVSLQLCEENLAVGQSVVLVLSMIGQIADYGAWKTLQEEASVSFADYKVKFIWILPKEEIEYARILERGAERDEYKLQHWDEYYAAISALQPDSRYQAYRYDNAHPKERNFNLLLKWITK